MMDPSIDAESQAHIPIIVVAVLLSVTAIVVCARTYTRAAMLHQFGADDCAVILALLLTFATDATVASNASNGAGRHMSTLDAETIKNYFRTFYISIVLYNASLAAIKLTFLLQYFRILSTNRMRVIVIVAFTVIGMWSLSQLLVVVFTCHPIERFWDHDVPGSCIAEVTFWYVNAAGNIATDVTIFVLPLPVLSSLSLRRAQKFWLLGIFSLGFFTCAISLIRIKYLKLTDDVTLDNVGSSCWSVTELSSGIICACLPTLRPLAAKLLPSLRSVSSRVAKTGSSLRSRLGKHAPASSSSAGGGGGQAGERNTVQSVVEILELKNVRADRWRKLRDLEARGSRVDKTEDSDGDLSDGILGLEDCRREDSRTEAQQSQGAALPSQGRQPPGVAVPRAVVQAHNLKAAGKRPVRVIGGQRRLPSNPSRFRPSVETEIKGGVAANDPNDKMKTASPPPKGGGIAIHYDITHTKSRESVMDRAK